MTLTRPLYSIYSIFLVVGLTTFKDMSSHQAYSPKLVEGVISEVRGARRHLKLGEQVPRLEQLPHLKARLKALEDIHEKKEVRWITDNCEKVPQGLWQSSLSSSSNSTVLLYDCGTGAL